MGENIRKYQSLLRQRRRDLYFWSGDSFYRPALRDFPDVMKSTSTAPLCGAIVLSPVVSTGT